MNDIFGGNFATALIVVFSFGTAVSGQVVLYVDRNATSEVHDGAGWCSAYLGLDEALTLAVAGDAIHVADGTYRPDASGWPHSGQASFQLKTGVQIEGGYAGCGALNPDERDVAEYRTVLTGDQLGNDATGFPFDTGGRDDNACHVVTGAGTDATAVLDGVTITGGFAHDCQRDETDARGSGIYIDGGSPIIHLPGRRGRGLGNGGHGVSFPSDRCATCRGRL